MNQPTAPGPQGGGSMKWLIIILVLVIVLGGGYLVYAKYGKGTTTTTASPLPTVTSSASTSSTPTSSSTETYDHAGLFSFQYPTGSFNVLNDGVAFWKTNGKGYILDNSFKISDYGSPKGLGPDLDQVEDKNKIVNAINTGDTSAILSATGLKSEAVEVKKLGTNNFLRILGGSPEGCFCYPLTYTTVVGDSFVQIGLFVRNTDIPDYNQQFVSDKEGLIKSNYNDIESVLKTFKAVSGN